MARHFGRPRVGHGSLRGCGQHPRGGRAGIRMTGLVAIIALALIFDFINGFHDAANSIATVVSTRVLSPRMAVFWAAFFNFVAFLIFETKVAGNIAKGVKADVVSLSIVGAGLVGAIIWDLLTWLWALPTSSSHALLGGFAGAAIVKAG